jgi:hypothetical protein
MLAPVADEEGKVAARNILSNSPAPESKSLAIAGVWTHRSGLRVNR